MAPPKDLVRQLYRSLLRYSRKMDTSPVHRSFLMAKPIRMYNRDESKAINVGFSSTPEASIAEQIFTRLNKGEYYRPKAIGEKSDNLSQSLRHYFRNGIPEQYGSLNDMQQIQLGFYVLKRFTSALGLLSNLPNSKQLVTQCNHWPSSQSRSIDDSQPLHPYLKPVTSLSHNFMPLKSLRLLELVDDASQCTNDESSATRKISQLEEGMLLVTHPMACVGTDVLFRKVIFLLEVSDERVIGVVLNYAYQLFSPLTKPSTAQRTAKSGPFKRQSRRRSSVGSSVTDCFQGWHQSYNYVGGPVDDHQFPFFVIHNSAPFFDKFKQDSTFMTGENSSAEEDRLYWTNVTTDNHEKVYASLLSVSRNEILAKNNELPSEDATADTGAEESEKIEKFLTDDDTFFKFVLRFTAWSPLQLKIEIENNVWFPVEITDTKELKNLLSTQCIYTPPPVPASSTPAEAEAEETDENEEDKKEKAAAAAIRQEEKEGEAETETESKKTSKSGPLLDKHRILELGGDFNSCMWQNVVRSIGNEFESIALAPGCDTHQTEYQTFINSYFEYMNEFYQHFYPEFEQVEKIEMRIDPPSKAQSSSASVEDSKSDESATNDTAKDSDSSDDSSDESEANLPT